METLIVTIDKDGSVHVDGEGFTGGQCVTAIQRLLKPLLAGEESPPIHRKMGPNTRLVATPATVSVRR